MSQSNIENPQSESIEGQIEDFHSPKSQNPEEIKEKEEIKKNTPKSKVLFASCNEEFQSPLKIDFKKFEIPVEQNEIIDQIQFQLNLTRISIKDKYGKKFDRELYKVKAVNFETLPQVQIMGFIKSIKENNIQLSESQNLYQNQKVIFKEFRGKMEENLKIEVQNFESQMKSHVETLISKLLDNFILMPYLIQNEKSENINLISQIRKDVQLLNNQTTEQIYQRVGLIQSQYYTLNSQQQQIKFEINQYLQNIERQSDVSLDFQQLIKEQLNFSKENLKNQLKNYENQYQIDFPLQLIQKQENLNQFNTKHLSNKLNEIKLEFTKKIETEIRKEYAFEIPHERIEYPNQFNPELVEVTRSLKIGDIILTGGHDGTLAGFDVIQNKIVFTQKNFHSKQITHLIKLSNNYAVSAGDDGYVNFFSVEPFSFVKKGQVHTLDLGQVYKIFDLIEVNDFIYALRIGNMLHSWEQPRFIHKYNKIEIADEISKLAYNKESNVLILGTQVGGVYILNPKNMDIIYGFVLNNESWIRHLDCAFIGGNLYVIASCDDNEVQILKLDVDKKLYEHHLTYFCQDNIENLEIDGENVVVCISNKLVSMKIEEFDQIEIGEFKQLELLKCVSKVSNEQIIIGVGQSECPILELIQN